ncbi:MAG: hypothetical protein IJW99_05430 [Clostridia bacterium]|nr:hypothetical protein [Clostridia bacterium]
MKAFEGVQRELFSKSSLWRGQGAEPLALFAPRYLHPDKPQFEILEPFDKSNFEEYPPFGVTEHFQKNFKFLLTNGDLCCIIVLVQ